MLCYFFPYITKQFFARLTFHQPRISVAIINIISCLPPRSIMHIQYNIQTFLATPLYNLIYHSKAVMIGSLSHIILIRKELIMKWYPHGIHTGLFDIFYIFFGYIILFKFIPKPICKIRPYHFTKSLIDQAIRACILKEKHISFGIEPVTQIDPLNKKFFTIGLYQIRSLYTDETIGRLFLFHLRLTG